MTPNISRYLQRICNDESSFSYINGTDDGLTHVIGANILMNGDYSQFLANIYVLDEDDFIDIIVPLYPDKRGLVGSNVGVFYQLLSELNLELKGDVKLGPYKWNNSNRPVLRQQIPFQYIKERVLREALDELLSNYIVVRPMLDFFISNLGLQFAENARFGNGFNELLLKASKFIRGELE